ncbi:MAG TPA: response regulator transcription factor [Conexibacter sp.]|jgi:two-component system response regulator NreC|nr:response regulator transcription factor [Conexibacter sp.]
MSAFATISLAPATPATPPATDTIRVALADDHEVVREGLALLLEQAHRIDVVGTAGDVETTLRLVAAQQPDVLVLDLRMPGGSSIEALPRFAQVAPHTAVVILTMHHHPAAARAALAAGANGYVLKESAGVELVLAVRLAHAGSTYLAPQLGARVAAEGDRGPDGLAPRELAVLRLLALGHTNPEVGERLHLSPRTVESYRARIQQKTGRTSRAQLVRYALDHELFDPHGD